MIAILTADIINSRNVPDPQVWLQPLKKILNRYGDEPSDWNLFRGDSFQLKIADPKEALKAAILIKATIKSVKTLDVRIAIGIGSQSFQSKKINESNGEAYINSGEQFEKLKKNTLAIRSPWEDFDDYMNVCLNLALLTMDNWTRSSAEIVSLSILHPGKTQQQLAEVFGISQGRISERQNRAGYEQIMQMEQYYTKLVSKYL